MADVPGREAGTTHIAPKAKVPRDDRRAGCARAGGRGRLSGGGGNTRGCAAALSDSVGPGTCDNASLEEVRCRGGGAPKPLNCRRRRRPGIQSPGDGEPELWKDEEGVAKTAAADGGQHHIISGQRIAY